MDSDAEDVKDNHYFINHLLTNTQWNIIKSKNLYDGGSKINCDVRYHHNSNISAALLCNTLQERGQYA